VNIEFRPHSRLEKFLDWILIPFMYVIAGTFKEKPQQTHKWNLRRLKPEQVQQLDASLFVKVAGADSFIRRHLGILFHFPILGGWKHYVTLKPEQNQEGWHIGWNDEVSAILLTGPVRVLRGPNGQSFFALSKSGEQIKIQQIGEGKIGNNDPDSKYPLL
jgi:predicted KAP-like P-loop ATPase